MAKIKIGTLYYNTNIEEGEIKIDDTFDAPIIVLDVIQDCIADLTTLYNKKIDSLAVDALNYDKSAN